MTNTTVEQSRWQEIAKAHARRNAGSPTGLEAFVSGRRGELAIHSKDLAEWMGIDNDLVIGMLAFQSSVRPESWFIGNCWNESKLYRLNHADGTFKTIRSYWISESVAMDLCRRFRKSLLPRLRQVFAQAREESIERQLAFAGGRRAAQAAKEVAA